LLGFGCRTPDPQHPHTLVVMLDYDFTERPACTATETKNCVKQFNVYELTSGVPLKLFSFPAPAGARGPVKGIKATSELMMLSPGDHLIGVAAVLVDGAESDPRARTFTAKVPPPAH
jgi:hypothetical protein